MMFKPCCLINVEGGLIMELDVIVEGQNSFIIKLLKEIGIHGKVSWVFEVSGKGCVESFGFI